jgi:hypothetical protein
MLNNLFLKSGRLCNNVEKYYRAGQATDDNMAHAHCMPKATTAHLEYVMLIAFPLQQWLRERIPLLHYKYVACLVTTETRSVFTVRYKLIIYNVDQTLSPISEKVVIYILLKSGFG